MSSVELKIDWATHEAAKYAVLNWHYSKRLPVFGTVKIGAWENGKFIGVVIFSRGATPEIGSPYGLKQTEICELTRVALRKHESHVSKILAIALRFLKQHSPGLKMVVSFADTTQGHHGGIYQATNWTYAGAAKTHAYKVVGKIWHPKSLHSKYGKGGQSIAWLRSNVDPHASRVDAGEKHRYLMPLTDEMRNQVAHLSQPYPKRSKQAMTGDHPEQRQCDTDPNAPISQAR
jgi:hypothetical protein